MVGEPLAKGSFFDNIYMAEQRVEGSTLASNGRFVAIVQDHGNVVVSKDNGAYERYM